MIKQLAEKLVGRKLEKADGIPSEELEIIEEVLGIKLPQLLHEFYCTIGKVEALTSSYEEFVSPEELYFVDGKLVFLEENQGVCSWGVDPSEDDPQVHMYTENDEGNSWYAEDVRLSEFLPIILYFQCAQGGYEYGAGINGNSITDEELEKLTRGWEKVVDHNRLVIYSQEEKLIWYFTNENGKLDRDGNFDMVFASALTEKGMEEMVNKYGFSEL